jgi:4-amino-4-deoxy-L-arabinose transferase-like glycosyltransferase
MDNFTQDSQKKEEFSEKLASKISDLFYSSNKKFILILSFLIIIGFILRLIAALNLGVTADDMLYASQSAGIWSSSVLSTHSNPPLLFYLTDLAYKIIGHTTLASRFWQLIFGTLLIPLSFLIGRKFFSDKIALFWAFFVTFSTFLIKLTYSEHSLVVLFFAMFGSYYGLEYFEKEKLKFIVLSGVLFGLAILTKYSAPFFILSFLIFSPIYIKYLNKKVLTKKNIRYLILFLLIIFIFSLPFLSFNYLLYKDKGIVDVYFSRIIQSEKTQQFYGDLAGQEESFFENLINISKYSTINYIFQIDLIIAIFAVLGMIIMFAKKQRLALYFILIFFLIPLILQTAGSGLAKHFIFMSFILALPAGYTLSIIFDNLNKKYLKYIIIILAVAMLFNLIFVGQHLPKNYLTASATSQLKSELNSVVEDNDIIVFDPRIYTARTFWLATPNHFISLLDFLQIYQENQNNPGNVLTDIYFVECAIDDCGWGTISSQPELNESSEIAFTEISSKSQDTIRIYEKISYIEEQNIYNIYKIQLSIPSELLNMVDEIQVFYFTPYLYKNMQSSPFKYKIISPIDKLLSFISYIIILCSVFLSFLSVLWIYKKIK